jgi:hypothetical protein
MKKLMIMLGVLVFSLGLMSACPEKKEAEGTAPETEMKTEGTMENKTEEAAPTEEGSGDESGKTDTENTDSTASTN